MLRKRATTGSLMTMSISIVMLLLPGSASAFEQHQNAMVVAYWTGSSSAGVVSSEQDVRFATKVTHTYLAQQWGFTGAENVGKGGGYAGLQTDGWRFDGSKGDMGIFSLWNATAAVAAPGAMCGTFGGEGVGYSCRRAMAIAETDWYKLRITRDGRATKKGQWWSASFQNVRTGQSLGLGKILVAGSKQLLTVPLNFSEYWGPAMPTCDAVPNSVAEWKAPRGVSASGAAITSTFRGSGRGSCTGGSATETTFDGAPGARVALGGSRI